MSLETSKTQKIGRKARFGARNAHFAALRDKAIRFFSKLLTNTGVAIRCCKMLLLGLGLASLAGLVPPAAQADTDRKLPPAPDKASKHRHGRLDSILNRVVAEFERSVEALSEAEGARAQSAAHSAASQAAARRAPMSQNESVAVTLRIGDPSKVDAIVRFLQDKGGDPRNIGEDYIEAYVPVSLLVEASKQPGVTRVQAIIPPVPKRGPVTSQGVSAHGADNWHAAGFTGKGVKVGVIDLGFQGLNDLMGTELPSWPLVHARCYIEMGEYTTDLEECEDIEGNHGTAVAEALLDVAPDVSLYIALVQTNGDLRNAVYWMASEGVEVINYSVNNLWDGPGNGTSLDSESPLKTVDAAVAQGILWVNAAGNEGQQAWFGTFNDSTEDDIHEFYYEEGFPYECNLFTLNEGDSIQVQLRWDGEWESNAHLADLDLYLYLQDGPESSILVEQSNQYQNPFDPDHRGIRIPAEVLQYEAKSSGRYCLRVEQFTGYSYRIPEPNWIQLMVESVQSMAPLSYPTPWGSIGNPAESANPGLLAVGAAPWYNPLMIEKYSSRGPTPDGRIKPDIVGVDMAHSSSYITDEAPQGAFPGTSQASPHVAGLAALVRNAYPQYSPKQVADYLKTHAQERWVLYPNGRVLDPNDVWGHGLAMLPPINDTETISISSDSLPLPIDLSSLFSNADANTSYSAISSNSELVAASVENGALILRPSEGATRGLAIVSVTARFRDGSQETIRLSVKVRMSVTESMRQNFFSGWRAALLTQGEAPTSTTTSTTTAFSNAFVEKQE